MSRTDYIGFPDPGVKDLNPFPAPGGFRMLELSIFERILTEIRNKKVVGSSMSPFQKLEFAEWQQTRRNIFGRILSKGDPFGLVLEAEEHYMISFKHKPKNGPHEGFTLDYSKFRKMKAEDLYAEILARFADFGFTVDVLKKRLTSVEYENGDVFDEFAHLVRQRINPDLEIYPCVSHHVGFSVINLLKLHMKGNGLMRLRTVLRTVKDTRVILIGFRVHQLFSEEVENDEEWFVETANAVATLLENLDAVPQQLLRLKSTALLIADFADLIVPIKVMKEHLMGTYDHSQHWKSWISARSVYKRVLAGKGGHRLAVLQGKVAKRSTGDQTDDMYFSDVITDLIELCDHRFAVKPESAARNA